MRSGASTVPAALRSVGFGRVNAPPVTTTEAEDCDPRSGPDVPFSERLLLTRPEAARVIGVGVTTLDELVAAGQVIACRVGRKPLFHRADLSDFVSRIREAAHRQAGKVQDQ